MKVNAILLGGHRLRSSRPQTAGTHAATRSETARLQSALTYRKNQGFRGALTYSHRLAGRVKGDALEGSAASRYLGFANSLSAFGRIRVQRGQIRVESGLIS